jgi:hypothetical protein
MARIFLFVSNWGWFCLKPLIAYVRVYVCVSCRTAEEDEDDEDEDEDE